MPDQYGQQNHQQNHQQNQPQPIPLPWIGTPDNPIENTHIIEPISREERVTGEVVSGDPLHKTFDPWELQEQDDGYNREHFYTRTVPTKKKGGNPKNVQVPFNHDHYTTMMKIIQQRMVPAYETVQDLIRDAVYHRLHDLSQMRDKHGAMYMGDPVVVDLVELDRAIARSEVALKKLRGEGDKVALIRETIDAAYATENRTMLAHAVEDGERLLEQMGGRSNRQELAGIVASAREKLNDLNRGGRY